MWYQRDSNQSKDLKRPRNEMLQIGVDQQVVPPLSKRAKTTQVPKTQTACSSSWHDGPKFHNSGEGSLQFPNSDHDNSTKSASNPITSLVFSHQQQQQQQQQQQSAGQQSSERIFLKHPQQEIHVGYQGMNCLLGSLHLSRRRQKASEAGVHQHSGQRRESSIAHHHDQSGGLQKEEWRPRRPKSSQKKVISLRVDSNLY